MDRIIEFIKVTSEFNAFIWKNYWDLFLVMFLVALFSTGLANYILNKKDKKGD